MKTITLRIVLPLLTFVIFPLCGYGQHPKEVGGRAVKSATWEGKQIRYASGQISVKLTPTTKRAQASALFDQYNARVVNPIGEGWGILQLPQEKNVLRVAKALKKSPIVSEAGPTGVGRTTLAPDDPYFRGDSPASYNHQWGLQNTGQSPPGGKTDADIDATAAWSETTGSSNTVIAVLDSGIPMQQDGDGDWDEDDLSHPDLDDPNKIILGPDYVNQQNGVKDQRGHGTHVAGIAAAESDNDKGVSGVCWECKLMVVQVTDAYGGLVWPDFYDGVKYAVDYAVNNNVELVINASLGGPTDQNGVAEDAVVYAENHGVLIVAAAGNEGGGDVLFPAAYSSGHSNVIAVSSTDHNDDFSSFSSSGSEVVVAAPGGHGKYVDGSTMRWDGFQNEGTNIYSTTPDYSFTLQSDPISQGDPYTSDISQDYGYLSGTSMAAPHVAGTAALLLSKDPSLSPSEVDIILRSTAEDVNGGGTDNQLGNGRINAEKAIEELTPPPAFSIQITNSGQTGQYVELDWDQVPSATSYEVYRHRSDGGSGFQQIGSTIYANYTDPETQIGHWSGNENAVYYAKAVNEYGSSTSNYTGTVIQGSGMTYAKQNEGGIALPDTTILEAPAPNPVREQATIRYGLPEATTVRLTVYDVMGRRVATLARGRVPAGYHEATLQAPALSSGVYLYRLEAGSFTETRRLTVVR